MNFFEKLFNRNPYPSDQIINFNTFAQLVGYMNWKCKHISIAVTDFPDMVHVELLSIPYDLLKIEKEVEALKKLGFDNYYQLINNVFKKGNIDAIDVEQFSRSKYDFNFLIIKFRAPNDTKEKTGAKYFDYSFIVRLCSENDSPKDNAFRMYYHKGFLSNYTLLFAKANWIGISATSSKGTKALIANLEKVMTAICAHAGIQLPNEIKKEQQVSYLPEKPLLSDFERAINLVNYPTAMSNITDLASDLYRLYVHPNVETFKFDHFSHRFRFIAKENVWDSDWKFEAGDAAHFIGEILGKEFTFSYPEDAYSDELFPHLQAVLDKDNLQLMNMDSLGDNYHFFIVEKKHGDEILALSHKLKLGINKI